MRLLLGASAAAAVVSSIFLGSVFLSTKISGTVLASPPDKSIVRLHDDQGRFFCTGVIISATQALTAAHCVVRDLGFIQLPIGTIEIRLGDNLPIGLKAEVIAANPRQDLAMLKGDFRGMMHRPIITRASRINQIMLDPDAQIMACGYPNGGPLQCSNLKLIHNLLFFFAAKGWLYPGMSGGPVIDRKTGAVLALNQAVTEAEVVVSPLIELYDNLGINEATNK